MNLSILVAISDNNVIGKNNRLIWHLPADLKHFKELTTGSTIIMGRKTLESIGRPLPNRRNIVISRSDSHAMEGVELTGSINEALDSSMLDENVFVIGGAEIYKQTIDKVNTLYVTKIHGNFEGDTFFPAIDENIWVETFREDHEPDDKNRHKYSFITYQRKA